MIKRISALVIGLVIGTATGCAVTDSQADPQLTPLPHGDYIFGVAVPVSGHEVPCVVLQKLGNIALSCNWNGLNVL